MSVTSTARTPRGLVAAIFCILLALLVVAPAAAQRGPVNGMRPADLRAHAIVDAAVVVAPGERLDRATILIRRGAIEAVGPDLPIPDDAWVWSGEGLTVYPGLIDPALLVSATADRSAVGAHWNAKVQPEVRMSEQPAPPARLRKTMRELGFAVAAVYPDTGAFRGSGTVIALADEDEHVLAYRDTAAMAAGFAYGGAWSSATYPGSLMGALALIRQTLHDAAWHRACRTVWAEHAEGNEPPIPAVALEALNDVVAGTQPVLFDVSDELMALRAVGLAEEFELDLMLLGSGTEFRRARELGDAGVPVICPLNYPKQPKIDSLRAAERVSLRTLQTWEQAPTNAARLLERGVPVALTTHRLEKRKGFYDAVRRAIKHGLEADDALAALTTTPATLLGLDDILGTIAPGKAANLVIVEGDLFDKKSTIRETWINGRRFEIKPRPEVKLAGAARLTTDGGASVPLKLDTERKTISITPDEGKPIKAHSVVVQKDQIAFVIDARPLGGAGGYARLDGVIVDGRVRGSGAMPDGAPFQFSIELDEAPVEEDDADRPTLAGAWSLTVRSASNPAGAPATLDLEEKDGAFSGTLSYDEQRAAVTAGDFTDGALALDLEGPDGVTWHLDAEITGPELAGALTGGDMEAELEGTRQAAAEDFHATAPTDLVTPLGAFGLPAPVEPQHVIVRGATIWTCGPDGIIDDGELEVRDGRIAYVGKKRSGSTGDALVIDGTGKHVTPGLIDCHSHTGIDGGVNEWTQANTAEVRIGDCVDPDDVNWYRQLAGGLTAANQLHGSANPIGGQNSVVKLKWGRTAADFRVDGAPGGIKFALGENVKRREGRYPDTRMGVATFIRDAFTAARDYRAAWQRYEGLSPTERARTYPPQRDLELDALVEILEGDRLIHCHSYRQDEILMLIRVADEFGFTIGTFQHVLEGYKVAEAIAEHGAGASSFSDWWAYKVEVMDAIPYNGAIMHDVGVLVSFNSDSNELARRMNTEAAKAVRYGGVDPHEALKFVTYNPAKQLRIHERTGSLEDGKDGDFVIWSAPPLSTYARCEQTWIEGARYFDLETDTQLRATARAERQRLVQKVLALSHGELKDEPAKTAAAAPVETTTRGRRPLLARMMDARRAWMAEQVRQGADPEAIMPGVCGSAVYWWEQAR